MKEYAFLNNALITVDEAKKEFSSENGLYSALKRLTDSGKIVKLKGGLYATINPLTKDIFPNRFEIATALYKGAYCAYHTAMEYYGMATQMFNDVHIITSVRYSPVVIEDLQYISFINEYSGGVAENFNNAPIRITEIERTVVDCMDRPLTAGGLEEVYLGLGMVSYCSEEKILKHLQGYNKKILYKKAGYLFSLIKPKYLSDRFYEICKDNMSPRIDDIRENKVAAYTYDNEWKIYAPKQITYKGY